jgi:hypothetical protein
MTTPTPAAVPPATLAHERWLIIYWDSDARKWVLAEAWADETSARSQLVLYRHELGAGRARMLHTADGA